MAFLTNAEIIGNISTNPNGYQDVKEFDFINFNEMLKIHDKYRIDFDECESANEFFSANALFGECFEKKDWNRIFYSVKCGFWFKGVNPRITYYFKKLLSEYDTPNNAISRIDSMVLSTFTKLDDLPNGVSFKVIMENLLGTSFEIIKEYKLYAKFGECYEVLVQSEKRIAILPAPFEVVVNDVEYLKSITLNKRGLEDKDGTLLRTMFNYKGITINEFDLRRLI